MKDKRKLPRDANVTGAKIATEAEAERHFVTALARGLDILGCFSSSRPEIGGTQLAAMTGLPQPTVWRLCYTMIRLGYLVPVSGDKLRPGIPVLKLGRAALASIPLAEIARAPMQAMANRFGSASGLGARDGGRMVFVQRCMSEAQLVMNVRVGARLPLLSSAVGWGLLAGMEEAERNALVAEYAPADPRWPEIRTIFEAAITGYATDGFILNLGVFHGDYNTAAVPVRGPDGRPIFALSCAGSATTHSAEFLRCRVAPTLLAIARDLEDAPEARRGQIS
jgi:DNA-binding IclR family transcriptional regulator